MSKRGYPEEEFEPWRDYYGKPVRKRLLVPKNVTPTTPLRLEIAARLAFPDRSMTISGLRNEIRKGNLQASMLAGRMYVTLDGIQQMRERCNIVAGDVTPKARNSISANPSVPVASDAGSSLTDHHPESESSKALAHLKVIAQKLRKPSPNISPKSTSQVSAVVIPLKS